MGHFTMATDAPSLWELRDHLSEFYRRCHGRMTDPIAFEAPITLDYVERAYELIYGHVGFAACRAERRRGAVD